jgi:predicted RNA binding protein YcfA (HicA-like mRNA interferase family)
VADYYRDLVRILRRNGFVLKRHGKGDHEIWWDPETGRRAVVAVKTKSRMTANAALKQAGLPKAF